MSCDKAKYNDHMHDTLFLFQKHCQFIYKSIGKMYPPRAQLYSRMNLPITDTSVWAIKFLLEKIRNF